MLGANLGLLLYGEVSVMLMFTETVRFSLKEKATLNDSASTMEDLLK